MTNKIKLRYGTKSVQKNYYEEQPEMEEVVVTDEPQKLVWDPDDYIVHPYQFNKKFTPLRLTALALPDLNCQRADFKTYSEIDELLNSKKEDKVNRKLEDFVMKPKAQKLTMQLNSIWQNWWGR